MMFTPPQNSTPVEEGLVPDIGYLVYRECIPSWRIVGKYDFPVWDLTYVTKGAVRYTIDGVDHDLAEGDFLCLPPGHARAAHTWPDRLMHCFAVNFDLRNLEGKPVNLPFPLVNRIGIRKDLIHYYREMVFTWMDKRPLYKIKVRALFLLILHRLCELKVYNIDTTARDFRVQKVTRYLTAHFAERMLVKQMADLVGLNEAYFGVLFKQETGSTMNQYLNRIRVRQAESMLRSGLTSVEEAADCCGYSDVFHFYKHFKGICGFPPSACIPKKRIL
jgi:AraC-like DNA-binding protein